MYLIEFYSLSDVVVAAGITQKTETHVNVGLAFKELIIVWDKQTLLRVNTKWRLPREVALPARPERKPECEERAEFGIPERAWCLPNRKTTVGKVK